MLTETKEITNSEDVIDVRDVIARFEELNAEHGEDADPLAEFDESGEAKEHALLKALLSDLEGNGGDEEWRGSWYPLTLVRDSYFEEFAEEEADSLGLISNDARWPYTCIDWERAARELRMDYSMVDSGPYGRQIRSLEGERGLVPSRYNDASAGKPTFTESRQWQTLKRRINVKSTNARTGLGLLSARLL